MIKCVVNSGLVVLKLIIHMNSTKCTKQSSPYSKSSTSVYLTLYTVCRSLLEKKKKKPGSTPNNLENPFTVPGFSAVVAMTTVHFISGSFEMVCEIRDPKCYVRRCVHCSRLGFPAAENLK